MGFSGNTFIGGVTTHREQFYCKNCGHIQWSSYSSSSRGFSHDFMDHLKCEICGSKDLKSKRDIEWDVSSSSFVKGMLLREGRKEDLKRVIGEQARNENILYQMKLREYDIAT